MSFRIAAGVAVLLLGSGLAAAQAPPVFPVRAQLDEVRRLASVLVQGPKGADSCRYRFRHGTDT